MTRHRKSLGAPQATHAEKAVESFASAEEWMDHAGDAYRRGDCVNAFHGITAANQAIAAARAHMESLPAVRRSPLDDTIAEPLGARLGQLSESFKRACVREKRK